ncbi:MAG: hypothetical protein ACOC2L_04240, partial [Candidatus Sumerlaeota bacterium]
MKTHVRDAGPDKRANHRENFFPETQYIRFTDSQTIKGSARIRHCAKKHLRLAMSALEQKPDYASSQFASLPICGGTTYSSSSLPLCLLHCP